MSDAAVQAAIAAGRVPSDLTAEYLSESYDAALLAAIGAIGAVTFVFFLLRMISRIGIARSFSVDDGLAAVCMVLIIVFAGINFELIEMGLARHDEYIQYVMPTSTLRYGEILDSTAYYVYMTTLLIGRLSGLAFYHRVICGSGASMPPYDPHNRGPRIAIWAIAAVHLVLYVPQMLLNVFHCMPVTESWPQEWKPAAGQYQCLDGVVIYGVGASISLFCDLLVFGIPVAMLRMLEMPKRRKLPLAGILFPGVFVVLISLARLVLIIESNYFTDSMFSYGTVQVVAVAEAGATLIALSVPGVKPLFDRCCCCCLGGARNSLRDTYDYKKRASEKGMLGSSSFTKIGSNATTTSAAPMDSSYDIQPYESHSHWSPIRWKEISYEAGCSASVARSSQSVTYDPHNIMVRRETVVEHNEA